VGRFLVESTDYFMTELSIIDILITILIDLRLILFLLQEKYATNTLSPQWNWPIVDLPDHPAATPLLPTHTRFCQLAMALSLLLFYPS